MKSFPYLTFFLPSSVSPSSIDLKVGTPGFLGSLITNVIQNSQIQDRDSNTKD